MRTLLLAVAALLAGANLMAQEAAPATSASQVPSVVDLTRLFSETTAGQRDPFQVMPGVVSLGDQVVPALRGFLFETPMIKVAVRDSTGAVIDSVNAPTPNRVYGAMALDLIGTPASYRVLADIVRSDSNVEVRATAVRAFAVSCYYRAVQDSSAADKQIVHLLIGVMDDTTYSQGCAMTIGAMARQGLKNWTGVDYGDILPDSVRAKDETRLGMAMAQFREQWWQHNSEALQWDKDAGCFDTTNVKSK